MTGETNIEILLKSMQPQLNNGQYVFCTLPAATVVPADAIMYFKEAEAETVIVKKETADAMGLPYPFVAAWITLTVHSSLEAVGLTAAFLAALANAGISCNVVAAFYHDHIFVPSQDAARAMEVLRSFAA